MVVLATAAALLLTTYYYYYRLLPMQHDDVASPPPTQHCCAWQHAHEALSLRHQAAQIAPRNIRFDVSWKRPIQIYCPSRHLQRKNRTSGWYQHLNAENVGHDPIPEPKPVDETARIAKFQLRKSSFWFQMFKCFQPNNFHTILKGLKSNELTHANLFFHALNEQQVLELASALIENSNAASGSILESIDIDWESLSSKSTTELSKTNHKVVLDNYNLMRRYSVGTKYNQLISKYKKKYPRALPFIAVCQHGSIHDVQQLSCVIMR